jgi:hypothetical protein
MWITSYIKVYIYVYIYIYLHPSLTPYIYIYINTYTYIHLISDVDYFLYKGADVVLGKPLKISELKAAIRMYYRDDDY